MSIQIESISVGDVLPYPQTEALTNVVVTVVYRNGAGQPDQTLTLSPPNPNDFLPLSEVNYDVICGWIKASTG